MVKPKSEAVNNWRLLEDDIVAALQSFQSPFWVIGGQFALRKLCPLYPQERTFAAAVGISVKCQTRDPQPARRAPARLRPHLPVHLARPVGGALSVRPRAGDGSRRRGRERTDRAGVRCARARLHPHPARRGAAG